MYRHADGSLTYSPTDLCMFLDSEFASWMDRWAVEHGVGKGSSTAGKAKPVADPHGAGVQCCSDAQDEQSKILSALGNRHEQKLLKHLKGRKLSVQVIADRGDAGHAQTQSAIEAGVDVVYQACLRLPRFEGYADFLVKRDGSSKLGDHHYEVWDTKLAKSVKPHYAIQLCAYAEMLEQLQGRRPDEVAVYLGREDDPEERLITSRYFFYYRHLRRTFERYHDPERWVGSAPPEPALSREFGRWAGYAGELLAKADHVSGVARITRLQVKRLRNDGITTMSQLAKLKKAVVSGIAPQTVNRLRQQARLQVDSRSQAAPLFETLPSDPSERRGLTLLPPPSEGDIFFDMEGYPLGESGNLEYLFGVVFKPLKGEKPSSSTTTTTDGLSFRAWWAHDPREEKRSFEAFLDWVQERRRIHPDLHIYHYNSYETAALKRLMGQFGTRETTLDDLLRGHVFVDLYQVVRQSMAIGTPGYSLKDIEACYGVKHEGDVSTAAGSVVAYHAYLGMRGIDDAKAAEILAQIGAYNETDCRSTAKLCDWLRERQKEANLSYVAPAAVTPEKKSSGVRLDEQISESLLAGVEKLAKKDPERARIQELLAHLVLFHRREDKPVYWAQFEREAMTEEELIDDPDCLGGLKRTKTPKIPVKQSWLYEYAFDPEQETKLYAGKDCLFAHDIKKGCELYALDMQKGRALLKLGRAPEPPADLSLIPDEVVPSAIIRKAVQRFGEAWAGGSETSQCVTDLLERRPPRIRGHGAGTPIAPDGSDVDAIVGKVLALDDSTICIQGPPGTGKTYTAAHLILALMRKGARVGVTATAHKAILNVLAAVHEHATAKERQAFQIVKVGNDDVDAEPLFRDGIVRHGGANSDIAAFTGMSSLVAGGTAWAFSDPRIAGQFDYLIVDEAGQFSLANAVAVGQAARNLVLVGDPVQLPQVTQGTHPGDAGKSCLEYLLGEHRTVPPSMGIFLAKSFRMHPDLCRFVSDAFYEGRLTNDPKTAKHSVACRKASAKGNVIQKACGVAYVAVEHQLNTQSSEEEVETIARLVDELVGGCFVDRSGKKRDITLDDIVIVAPYNLQVRQLQRRLPKARIGTVDKFQGQEAPVAIVSLCASSGEECPRGLDFLLNRNRLNVAISRAKALAIVVGCPDLMATRCSSLGQMELVNNLCWLAEHAGWPANS